MKLLFVLLVVIGFFVDAKPKTLLEGLIEGRAKCKAIYDDVYKTSPLEWAPGTEEKVATEDKVATVKCAEAMRNSVKGTTITRLPGETDEQAIARITDEFESRAGEVDMTVKKIDPNSQIIGGFFSTIVRAGKSLVTKTVGIAKKAVVEVYKATVGAVVDAAGEVIKDGVLTMIGKGKEE